MNDRLNQQLESRRYNSVTMKRRRTRTRTNWLALPRDILIIIFSKLDTAEILCHAQFVCSSWLQLAQERHLFRSMSLGNVPPNLSKDGALKLCKAAVDRSCGELLHLSIGQDWYNEELPLLHCFIYKSKSLRSLRISISITENELLEAFRNLPLLEEFELSNNSCSSEVIKELGYSCSRLKHFGLYISGAPPPNVKHCEDIELSIAENLPRLQTLSLYRMWITNRGLQSILDRCSLIKNLDFSKCYSNDMAENLQKTCLNKFADFQVPSKRHDVFVGRVGDNGDNVFDGRVGLDGYIPPKRCLAVLITMKRVRS